MPSTAVTHRAGPPPLRPIAEVSPAVQQRGFATGPGSPGVAYGVSAAQLVAQRVVRLPHLEALTGILPHDSWIMLYSEAESKSFTYSTQRIRIGRDSGADVQLNSESVSRRHCEITMEVHVVREERRTSLEATTASTSVNKQQRSTLKREEMAEEGRKGGAQPQRSMSSAHHVESETAAHDTCAGETDKPVVWQMWRRVNRNALSATHHIQSPVTDTNNSTTTSTRDAKDFASLSAHFTESRAAVSKPPALIVEDAHAPVAWSPASSSSTASSLNLDSDNPGTVVIRVYVTDWSANGTYVNDVRVPRGTRQELRTGDTIGFVRLPSHGHASSTAADATQMLDTHAWDGLRTGVGLERPTAHVPTSLHASPLRRPRHGDEEDHRVEEDVEGTAQLAPIAGTATRTPQSHSRIASSSYSPTTAAASTAKKASPDSPSEAPALGQCNEEFSEAESSAGDEANRHSARAYDYAATWAVHLYIPKPHASLTSPFTASLAIPTPSSLTPLSLPAASSGGTGTHGPELPCASQDKDKEDERTATARQGEKGQKKEERMTPPCQVYMAGALPSAEDPDSLAGIIISPRSAAILRELTTTAEVAHAEWGPMGTMRVGAEEGAIGTTTRMGNSVYQDAVGRRHDSMPPAVANLGLTQPAREAASQTLMRAPLNEVPVMTPVFGREDWGMDGVSQPHHVDAGYLGHTTQGGLSTPAPAPPSFSQQATPRLSHPYPSSTPRGSDVVPAMTSPPISVPSDPFNEAVRMAELDVAVLEMPAPTVLEPDDEEVEGEAEGGSNKNEQTTEDVIVDAVPLGPAGAVGCISPSVTTARHGRKRKLSPNNSSSRVGATTLGEYVTLLDRKSSGFIVPDTRRRGPSASSTASNTRVPFGGDGGSGGVSFGLADDDRLLISPPPSSAGTLTCVTPPTSFGMEQSLMTTPDIAPMSLSSSATAVGSAGVGVGASIGAPRYRVLPTRKIQWGQRIGAGASGEVYCGIDVATSMMVAIKVLKGTSSHPFIPRTHQREKPRCASREGYVSRSDGTDRENEEDCADDESETNHDEEWRGRDRAPRSYQKNNAKEGPLSSHRDAVEETAHGDASANDNTLLTMSDISLGCHSPTDTLTPPPTHAATAVNEEVDAGEDVPPLPRPPAEQRAETTDDRRRHTHRRAEAQARTPQGSDTHAAAAAPIPAIHRSHLRELYALTQLHHRRIVRCLGFQHVERKGLCIFMEYVGGGSLQALIRTFGAFHENLIRLYAIQILEGLEYLTKMRIVHGDLKSANVLVSERGEVKLTDFGTTRIRRQASEGAADENAAHMRFDDVVDELLGTQEAAQGGTLCGTPLYMSPELIRTQVTTTASDVWALGCIVFEMATGGVLPWQEVRDASPLEVIYYIGSHMEEGPSFADVFQCREALAAEEEAEYQLQRSKEKAKAKRKKMRETRQDQRSHGSDPLGGSRGDEQRERGTHLDDAVSPSHAQERTPRMSPQSVVLPASSAGSDWPLMAPASPGGSVDGRSSSGSGVSGRRSLTLRHRDDGPGKNEDEDENEGSEDNEDDEAGVGPSDHAPHAVTPTPLFMDFLTSMFTMNPNARPTPTELLRHPFITGVAPPPEAAVNRWRRAVRARAEAKEQASGRTTATASAATLTVGAAPTRAITASTSPSRGDEHRYLEESDEEAREACTPAGASSTSPYPHFPSQPLPTQTPALETVGKVCASQKRHPPQADEREEDQEETTIAAQSSRDHASSEVSLAKNEAGSQSAAGGGGAEAEPVPSQEAHSQPLIPAPPSGATGMAAPDAVTSPYSPHAALASYNHNSSSSGAFRAVPFVSSFSDRQYDASRTGTSSGPATARSPSALASPEAMTSSAQTAVSESTATPTPGGRTRSAHDGRNISTQQPPPPSYNKAMGRAGWSQRGAGTASHKRGGGGRGGGGGGGPAVTSPSTPLHTPVLVSGQARMQDHRKFLRENELNRRFRQREALRSFALTQPPPEPHQSNKARRLAGAPHHAGGPMSAPPNVVAGGGAGPSVANDRGYGNTNNTGHRYGTNNSGQYAAAQNWESRFHPMPNTQLGVGGGMRPSGAYTQPELAMSSMMVMSMPYDPNASASSTTLMHIRSMPAVPTVPVPTVAVVPPHLTQTAPMPMSATAMALGPSLVADTPRSGLTTIFSDMQLSALSPAVAGQPDNAARGPGFYTSRPMPGGRGGGGGAKPSAHAPSSPRARDRGPAATKAFGTSPSVLGEAPSADGVAASTASGLTMDFAGIHLAPHAPPQYDAVHSGVAVASPLTHAHAAAVPSMSTRLADTGRGPGGISHNSGAQLNTNPIAAAGAAVTNTGGGVLGAGPVSRRTSRGQETSRASVKRFMSTQKGVARRARGVLGESPALRQGRAKAAVLRRFSSAASGRGASPSRRARRLESHDLPPEVGSSTADESDNTAAEAAPHAAVAHLPAGAGGSRGGGRRSARPARVPAGRKRKATQATRKAFTTAPAEDVKSCDVKVETATAHEGKARAMIKARKAPSKRRRSDTTKKKE